VESLNCKNCGARFSDERAELGYDYCSRKECVDACFKPLDLVAVAVNKASDQYVLRRHLDLPPQPPARKPGRDEGGWLSGLRTKEPAKAPQLDTTAARIARLEAELDAALQTEHDPARRAKLVNDYNARLRRLNIRYRQSAQRKA
jgi:hypothetical protein